MTKTTSRIVARSVREQVGQTTVDRIIEATLTCVSQMGIAATSTRQIARVAGVKQGVLHYHFKNKDELLLKLLELLYQNSAANIDALAEVDLPPRQRLEAIIDLGFDLIGRRRDEFVALIAYWAHAMTADHTWREAYRRTFADFRAAILRIIQEGEEAGDFRRGSAAMIPLLIVSIVQGIGLQIALEPGEINVERAKASAKQALRALLPPA